MEDCSEDGLVGFESVYRKELEEIDARRKARALGAAPTLQSFSRDEENHPTDFQMSDLTGICLSGGGIRSSAFSIGALQALDALTCEKASPKDAHGDRTLFNRFDYMSTVSGGGYTGTAVTASMMDSPRFPLESSLDKEESPELQHIRDHSNYLFPKGGILEKTENLGVLLRGIFAHLPVILSVLMVSVCICVWSNPTIADLGTPIFKISETASQREFSGIYLVIWACLALAFVYLIMGGPLPWSGGKAKKKSSNVSLVMLIIGAMFSTGMVCYILFPSVFYGIFRIAMLMMAFLVAVMLLLGWWRSAAPVAWREVGSRNTAAIGWLLLLVAFVAFANLQPYLIGQIHESYLEEARAARLLELQNSADAGQLAGKGQRTIQNQKIAADELPPSATANVPEGGLIEVTSRLVNRVVSYTAGVLSTIAGVVATIAAFVGKGSATENTQSGFVAFFKRNSKNLVFLLVGLALPFVFWYLYLNLSYAGIMANQLTRESMNVPLKEHPNWMRFLVINANGSIVEDYQRLPSSYIWVTALLVLYSLLLVRNRNSMHGLYKDRLSQAFVNCKRNDPDFDPKLSEINSETGPFHLINAALNVHGSEVVNKRGRNAEFFTFSKTHVGSDATTYVETEAMEEREKDIRLSTAMAISAAAASTAMGSRTLRPLALTLAVFNVRLGYWLRNPRCVRETGLGARIIHRLIDIPYYYLFAEITGMLNEDRGLVYLSDGGHLENLGLYSLLKRRCKFIVVVDGEADPQLNFSSFVTAQRYARIDLGTRIELPFDEIQKASRSCREWIDDRKTTASDRQPFRLKGPHCSLGLIHYPKDGDGNRQTGILLYVKSSITGDENDYVRDYARRNSSFPHETTGDQFFSEEQFEAYRSLGFHALFGALRGSNLVDTAGGAVTLTKEGLKALKSGKKLSAKHTAALEEFLKLFPHIKVR